MTSTYCRSSYLNTAMACWTSEGNLHGWRVSCRTLSEFEWKIESALYQNWTNDKVSIFSSDINKVTRGWLDMNFSSLKSACRVWYNFSGQSNMTKCSLTWYDEGWTWLRIRNAEFPWDSLDRFLDNIQHLVTEYWTILSSETRCYENHGCFLQWRRTAADRVFPPSQGLLLERVWTWIFISIFINVFRVSTRVFIDVPIGTSRAHIPSSQSACYDTTFMSKGSKKAELICTNWA